MRVEPVQVLRCGNCGADVPITSPATLTVTCGHCNVMSRRTDVDLETIGEVALAAPLRSHFAIGTEGSFDARPFVVRGQVQLDHGAGLWNEWAAETEQGWLWISEAQGEVHVYEELHVSNPPDRSRLPDMDPDTGDFSYGGGDQFLAGRRINIDGKRSWMIKEIGRGDVITVRGELPVDLRAGTRTTYVDLVRGGGEVATLDFTRPGETEVLTGRRVGLDELVLDPSTQPDDEAETVKSERVTCSNCGGVIEVVDPEKALTLGCVHCGTLLQRGTHLEDYHAVEAAERIEREPDIKIGSVGELGGEELTVIGYLRRGVRADGRLYPWSEYLLRTPEGAYRWLVESDGHFTLARPASPSAFPRTGGGLKVDGERARAFSTGKAMVDSVLGEFYWQVRTGETVEANDYVLPTRGLMVSVESTDLEISASLGRHLDREEVMSAFPGADLPRVRGVGAVQPSPFAPGVVWKAFGAAVVALFVLGIALRSSAANEVVHQGTYGPTPATSSEDAVEFSEPFVIKEDEANLKLTVRAPTVNQGYLDVLGALVNEETGEVRTFNTAAQYYSGVSGGESWREGNRRGSVLLGRVPAGTYRLRLASRGYDKAVSTNYSVTAKSQVPRLLYFVLALLLLTVYPIIIASRSGAFEARRWANSDF